MAPRRPIDGKVNDAMTDAAPVVVALNRDLMFGSRISSVVKALGFAPRLVKDTDAFALAVREADPALAIVDMNGPVDWGAIAALAADPAVTTPLLGFGPHVDVDGRRAAKAAGMTRIVSNGDFHRDTAELISRYARPAGQPGDLR